MTWFPLQAALKMSTLPGAIQATLDHLLDHINAWKDPSTGRADPTRPQTLTVFESLTQLAADTGFSTVSVADHLKRLRGEKELRKGLTVKVLLHDPDPEKDGAKHHRAARYHLNPAGLDALVDPKRLEAFTHGRHHPDHPYQLWRDWRTANRPPQPDDQADSSEGISSLYPEPVTEDGQGISSLYAEAGQGISSLGDRVQAPYTEFTNVVDPVNQLTSFVPHPAPTAPEKKEEGCSRTQTKPKTKTPAPPTLDLTDELRAWVQDHARQVDLTFERAKFLQHCRAHETENVNWIEAFKGWLLEADRRARQHGPRPVARVRREPTAEDAVIEAYLAAREVPAALPGGEAAWVRIGPYHGKHLDCGTVHQYHAPCPAATSVRTPATDAGPPPESSVFHQRQVVQEAKAHGFAGVGELVAAVAPNGNGHGHHPEQEAPT